MKRAIRKSLRTQKDDLRAGGWRVQSAN